MTPSTISSRDFARDLSRAKRAAAEGPVFITDRRKPRFALLSIEEYHRLAGHSKGARSLLDAMQELPRAQKEFEPARLSLSLRPAEFD